MTNSNSQVWFGLIVLLGLLALAACGGGSSSSVTPPQTTYSVGGTVSGLTGTGLTLQNNGGNTLSVTSATFTFTTKLPSGGSYDVTISAQPSGQTCTPSDNSGTVGSANVTTVLITCTTPPSTVSISNSPCATSAEPPCPIGVGANWQYTAAVSGASNQNVTWSVSANGGTIDANNGLYIAPLTVPSPANVTITATSQANSTQSASTTVTVQATDPIGSVSGVTTLPSCIGSLQGATCYQMTVSCPGVADLSVYLKVNNPNAAPVGTVLFGVGTGGSGLYDDPNSSGFSNGETTVQNILAGNFNTVQVSFGAPFTPNQPNGWLQGPGGVRRVACRYATVADWVYHNPKTINSNPNNTATTSAPMCATGNSGGSAAIAYAVYEYGRDTEFAMIEPTSGPPMTRIDMGCSPCSSNVTGPVCQDSSSMNVAQMCYSAGGSSFGDAGVIDTAYTASQNETSPGLCASAVDGTPAPAGLFQSDSILYNPGNKISLPNTTVKMLFGDLDTSNAVPQGMVWGQSVSPSPLAACIADAGHPIPDVNDGARQIASDIQQYCH